MVRLSELGDLCVADSSAAATPTARSGAPRLFGRARSECSLRVCSKDVSDAIEEIYDRLVAQEKLKSGTKFERVAALVFQILDRSALVVHDVVLRAQGKEASHQIDVTATSRSGTSRRVIVEVRDRRDRVDLGQVRDFFGVVHQLRTDRAWIVSVTGFTADAVRYARDEGIGLAELRPAGPGEDDRIKAIHVKLAMMAMGTPTVTAWIAADDEERTRLQTALQDIEGTVERVDTESQFFYDEAGKRVATLREVLEPIFNSLELELGENEGSYEFDSVRWLNLGGVRAAVRGFAYRVELSQGIHEFTVGNASSVAELIFRSVDGTVASPVDRVIYDTDLAGLTLDPDGRIVPRAA